jgi:16S rRNA (cytidine1402-2'-O)-methyltransferase
LLYLVATPIGNLADISLRALETLKRCDYILCEDTRHSLHLLQRHQIQRPLRSFHAFNESKESEKVLSDLKGGMHIALISDAGTPLFADPGFGLVRRCKEEGIDVTAIPGANAALTALLLSGFPVFPFQCLGFFPKKLSELTDFISRLLLYKGTSICYETPHRLLDTLELFKKMGPDRLLCVARELTKQYEECRTATSEELTAHFVENTPRGEITLLIAPPPEGVEFEKLSTKELVAYLQEEFALPLNAAIKLAAELHAIPKKKIYKEIHVEK